MGQDAMVRTLKNAIAENRLAHAFILTGVRGVGKTSTARLIARALNCTGNGNTGPTMEPCGECEQCRAIAESRHVDVLEMDAASRTGVDDIREIIDGVRYAPVNARYKVYIIDEVHMLSKNAFNALLKTLEEPPEHVKFIFATTEIRKVPVTVLSRCQRFDLKRVTPEVLTAHFAKLAEKEGASVEEGALALIARAAEGSVRDGLSLLDQAISHGAGTVTEEQVRDMLGVVDRGLILDLFDSVMKGDMPSALNILRQQYEGGADPIVILQDLLEIVHWMTRRRAAGDGMDDAALSPEMKERGAQMAETLSMAVLSRSWQMLLKGLEEVRMAPSPMAAAEMAIIRLAYSANLPTPGDLVRQLSGQESTSAASPAAAPQREPAPQPVAQAIQSQAPVEPEDEAPPAYLDEAPLPGAIPNQPPPAADEDAPLAQPTSFRDVIELAGQRREILLKAHLMDLVHLVRFRPGHIDFRPEPNAPADLAIKLSRHLKAWTGKPWVVSISQEEGEPTEHDQDIARAMADPLVKDIMQAFPGTEIISVSPPEKSGADSDMSTAPVAGQTRGEDRR
jgi:DNA polymerase-3 subunit gamma/tau